MDYIEIENQFLKARISLYGAELLSLYDKSEAREMLWQGDSEIWNSTSPILFPFVGNLNNQSYRFNGVVYNMSRHGFARTSIFTLIEVNSELLKLQLKSNEQLKKIYPFEFNFEIIYQLEDNKLKVDFEIKNEGLNEMYFNLGIHPGFRIPRNEFSSFDDYYIKFIENNKLKTLDIDDKGLLNGENSDINFEEEYLIKNLVPPGKSLIFEKLDIRAIRIYSKKEKGILEIEANQFPDLVLWRANGDKSNFICVEPWEGLPDESGFAGDLSDKRGIVRLDSNNTFTRSFRISIL